MTIRDEQLSIVKGPTSPPLLQTTIGGLLEEQAAKFPDRLAVISTWQSERVTFKELDRRSEVIAKGLLDAGLRSGQTVGIMAGNRVEYFEVVLGTGRIGCPLVVLNNTYIPAELKTALEKADVRVLFIASHVGYRSLGPHIDMISGTRPRELQKIVILDGPESTNTITQSYKTFTAKAREASISSKELRAIQAALKPDDVINLQFTSGTTGAPKATMLTHFNIINDGYLIGDRMRITKQDILCCPPPLFHCFGLVIGFMVTFVFGAAIVLTSDQFDPVAVLNAVEKERCTALHGVPTMFIAELEANKTLRRKLNTVRTGVAAGSAVPAALLEKLNEQMGMQLEICYGMTETSPVTFMTSPDDPKEARLRSLGKVMPHTMAKIVDSKGNIVPRGQRGELCTAGFALQKGYWKEKAKTDEVMRRDENGVLWMHTGDECYIDEEGFCHFESRLKDVIIRGGENIMPFEIENRLLEHPNIADVSVIGVTDERYGEVVGAFFKQQPGTNRPSVKELATFVQETLGRHKAVVHAFWLGDAGVGEELAKTGSGKHQKHLMRKLANDLLKGKNVEPRSKL